MTGVLEALVTTLVIEVPVVAYCFPRQRVRMALVATLANTLTNLTLNVILPRIPSLHQCYLVMGESLALIIEAFAYAAATRPRDIGRSLAVAAVSNALSYELGGALLTAIAR